MSETSNVCSALIAVGVEGGDVEQSDEFDEKVKTQLPVVLWGVTLHDTAVIKSLCAIKSSL